MAPEPVATESRYEWMIPVVLSILFAATVAHTWGRWGEIYVDAGGALDRAARMAQGELLYRDVQSPYGPVGSYTLAGAFRIFGIHLTTAYALAIAVLAAQCVAMWTIGRRFLGSLETGFGVLVFWSLQGISPELTSWVMPNTFASILGAFFATLTIALVLVESERHQQMKLIAASCAAALAGLSKIEFGVAAVGGIVTAISLGPRSVAEKGRLLVLALAPGAGLTAVAIVTLCILVPPETLFGDNLYRERTLSFVVAATRGWSSAPLWPKLEQALLRYGIELPLRAAVVALGASMVSRSIPKSVIGLSLIVAAVGVPLAPGYPRLKEFLGWRPGPPYYWAPTGWALVAAVAGGIHRRAPSPRTKAILVVAAFAFLLSLRWNFRLRLASYYGFLGPFLLILMVRSIASAIMRRRIPQWVVISVFAASFAWAILFRSRQFDSRVHELDYPRGFIADRPDRAAPLREVVDYVRANSSGGDYVAVIPEERLINFLAERRNPTSDSGIGPGWLATAEDQRRFVEELEARSTPLVVVSTRPFPEFERGDVAEYAPAVVDHIRRNYQKGPTFGRGWRTLTVFKRTPFDASEAGSARHSLSTAP